MEYKLRAWDKEKKKYVTDFVLAPTRPTWGAFPIEQAEQISKYQEIIHKHLGVIDEDWKWDLSYFSTSDYTLTDWANFYGLNNYEVELWSGIKDWFAGDILRTTHFKSKGVQHYLYHVIVYIEEYGAFFAINVRNFNKGNFTFENGNCLLYLMKKQESEKCGNINENPELLKEEDIGNT